MPPFLGLLGSALTHAGIPLANSAFSTMPGSAAPILGNAVAPSFGIPANVANTQYQAGAPSFWQRFQMMQQRGQNDPRSQDAYAAMMAARQPQMLQQMAIPNLGMGRVVGNGAYY